MKGVTGGKVGKDEISGETGRKVWKAVRGDNSIFVLV